MLKSLVMLSSCLYLILSILYSFCLIFFSWLYTFLFLSELFFLPFIRFPYRSFLSKILWNIIASQQFQLSFQADDLKIKYIYLISIYFYMFYSCNCFANFFILIIN
ncbi:hypothetical protein EDEG_04131 [Edhazardia aedis USNM 41457]|uniref:Uncharacterized protein n=1 Tax=Edhazardia aedis (strain USNM 41457) TaxID=1003232 RepID=J9DBZ7_EDHAE|nr:hypothetical protein EDEG_04131 [Edhazardia aedis USNM 41457]|eukprot:EJW05019.1 hypothetical protein EDEG_04131 [Edhazardia aedis USNM 41457]